MFNRIFDFTGFAGFDRTGFGFDNSDAAEDLSNFDSFNMEDKSGLHPQNYQFAGPSDLNSSWYLRSPEVGGASQQYPGADVLGDPNGLTHLHNLMTPPAQIYPGDQESLNEG